MLDANPIIGNICNFSRLRNHQKSLKILRRQTNDADRRTDDKNGQQKNDISIINDIPNTIKKSKD